MAPRRTRNSAAAADATLEPHQLSSPPATPAPTKKRAPRKAKATASPIVKQEEPQEKESKAPATPATNPRKRARGPAKLEPASDDLPHNLSSIPAPATDDAAPAKKRARQSKKTKEIKPDPEEAKAVAEKAGLISPPDEATPKKASKKAKTGTYGLTPGQSPYPNYPHPTPEECHEVVRLLTKVHGAVSAPKTIPQPSLTNSGCGEVPSVLDALIRTRLSAATTNLNSSRAFQGLVKTFGTLNSGVGKGSVDWNAVRQAPQKEVFEAIKCGGLADNKSKDIKAILQSVWEENRTRSAAIKDEGPSPSNSAAAASATAADTSAAAGTEHEPASEKAAEVARADADVLSLDHLHLLSSTEAFNKLIQYPGIGPKTASCVLLFCLQRPSFAVDTHVFRLCKYLGWVPADGAVAKGEPRVERNSTYSHCEVRIPDELKYQLHYLLIRHGKSCPRCRAATGLGSEGWAKGCPIEHLVKRHGAKKGGSGGGAVKVGKKGGAKRRKSADSDESEEAEESSGLSDEESDFQGDSD